MSFNNFLKGALDRVPDGLEFGQAVHRGRFANEKMGMEREQLEMGRQQFANQQRLYDLQIANAEDENRNVDVMFLVKQIAPEVAPAQEELLRFYSTLQNADGTIKQKYLKDGLEYINKQDTVARLFPSTVAFYEQKLAGLKKELANPQVASGGVAVDPQLIQQQIKATEGKLENLRWSNPAYVNKTQFDYNVKMDEKKLELDRIKALRTGGGDGDNMNSVMNNIMNNAQKEFAEVWKLTLNNSTIPIKDQYGNVTGYQFMVKRTRRTPDGKVVQYQDKATPTEIDQLYQEKWDQTYNRVRNSGLAAYGIAPANSHAPSLGNPGQNKYGVAGMDVSVEVPDTGTKPDGNTKAAGTSVPPKEALPKGKPKEDFSKLRMPGFEGKKFQGYWPTTPYDQRAAMIEREYASGVIDRKQYEARMQSLEGASKIKYRRIPEVR